MVCNIVYIWYIRWKILVVFAVQTIQHCWRPLLRWICTDDDHHWSQVRWHECSWSTAMLNNSLQTPRCCCHEREGYSTAHLGFSYTWNHKRLWTSDKTNGSYVTVTAHFLDGEWQTRSAVLAISDAEDKHTAVYIRKLVTGILQENDVNPKNAVYVTDSWLLEEQGNSVASPQLTGERYSRHTSNKYEPSHSLAGLSRSDVHSLVHTLLMDSYSYMDWTEQSLLIEALLNWTLLKWILLSYFCQLVGISFHKNMQEDFLIVKSVLRHFAAIEFYLSIIIKHGDEYSCLRGRMGTGMVAAGTGWGWGRNWN